jgi:hypothetical protein
MAENNRPLEVGDWVKHKYNPSAYGKVISITSQPSNANRLIQVEWPNMQTGRMGGGGSFSCMENALERDESLRSLYESAK